MKALSFHRLVILGVLIFASVLLAASATAQLPTPSSGTNLDAEEQTGVASALGNPAAVYCRDLGYEYQIAGDDGQRGFCTLPDGQVCDAWEFLQGKCGQNYSYCAQQGYEIITLSDGQNSLSPEYAVCVTSEGAVIGSVTELSNLSEKATGCGGETLGGEMPPLFGEGDEYVPRVDADPPTSFDWRSYLGSDWLSPVKNQGSCGSCWAFSAVGVTEAAHNIANNNPDLDLNLSEQYLVADCSATGTCCGGSKSSALQYIRDSGVPDEACMTYVDGTGCTCDGGTCDTVCMYRIDGNCSDRTCSNRCWDWSSRLTHITSTGWVGTDRQTIKQALVDTGPLAVSMGWGSDFGGYWDDERVYHCSSDTGTNHAVIAVGYSDAGSYWIIKNSWGTGWEDGGYFKLGYGECYVERYVYYADAGIADVGPLVYDSHIIDDDTSTSSGNDDGIVDCGETIELNVILRNEGTDTATGVAASLSTTDSLISITDSEEYFPDILGGGTGEDSADYDFVVDPATPDGHIIQFDLGITASNGGPWTDSFNVPVACSTNSPPNTPSSPSPADGATGVSVTIDLSWTGGDPDPGDTVTYDVYFGTTNPPTTLLCNDTASPTCDPGTLAYSTPYYWYVVATDNVGDSTSGPVWDFATGSTPNNPPYTPSSPSPADGTTDVSSTSDLAWTGGDPDPGDTVTYDVFFGTANPPTTLLCNDTASPTCDPGTLAYSTPYYWYVVATDNHGASTSGPVWDFTTAAGGGDVGPLEYDSHLVDDDTYNESFGDGDGIVECGESIELWVDLINQGTEAATLVDATISTSDPLVTWLHNTSSDYPEIPGGGTGTNILDFDFAMDPDTLNGHIIQFDLAITSYDGGPWTDSFDVPVSCNSPPNTPSSPSPADGATSVPVTADLSWTGGDPDPGDTVTYDVYLGYTTPPTALLCNDTANLTCDPSTLPFNTLNYWYVVATDNHGASTSGPVWDFVTTAGSDAFEEDDTSGQASSIYDGTPQTHSIAPVGDVDWVKFSLSTESEVVIETSGPSGDTRMWLYDSGLNELEYDNDNGTGAFSRIDRLCDEDALPTGTYYVKIDEFGNNAEIPSYDISFTVIQTCDNAGPLVYDSHLIDDDTITSNGDGDGIVDCGETIELNVTLANQGTEATMGITASLSTTAPYVTITDSQEGFPDIAGGGTGEDIEDFDFVVDPAAPHGHVIAFELNATAANGGSWSSVFEVLVECSASCNDPGEPNDEPGQAVPISYGTELAGRDICLAGDMDYYSFSGAAGDTILADIDAQATDSPLDSYLVLYGPDGVTELTHNDDFDGLDSLISYTLPAAGTYYLMVREYSHPDEGGPGYTYQISLVDLDHRVYLPLVLRDQD